MLLHQQFPCLYTHVVTWFVEILMVTLFAAHAWQVYTVLRRAQINTKLFRLALTEAQRAEVWKSHLFFRRWGSKRYILLVVACIVAVMWAIEVAIGHVTRPKHDSPFPNLFLYTEVCSSSARYRLVRFVSFVFI